MSEEDPLISTMWEHIDAFRSVLVKSLALIVIAFVCFLPFYKPLFGFLTTAISSSPQPSTEGIVRIPVVQERVYNADKTPVVYLETPEERIVSFSIGAEKLEGNRWHIPALGQLIVEKTVLPVTPLAILHPLEGITIAFKLSFWMSILVTSPFWLYFLLQFFLPALTVQERALAVPFVMVSLLCFSAGISMAYFVTLPLAVQSLHYFNQGLGVSLWGLTNTIDFFFFIFFSNGLAFESCVVLFFLIHLQVLGAQTLIACRRQAIVGIFILSAVLTPPDVVTQVFLAIPLAGVYELAILYARSLEPKKALNSIKTLY